MNPVKNELNDHDNTAHFANQEYSEQHILFIENENNCPLCDSKLEIKTRNSEILYKVYEEAHCQSCKIKTRDKLYSMH